MKGLNLGTAIYGLVFSIFLLFVPLITASIVAGEVLDSSMKGSASEFDITIRVFSAIVLGLATALLAKDSVASNAGKILLVISASIVILFSSFFGFPAGVVGIVGSSLLLASNKKNN